MQEGMNTLTGYASSGHGAKRDAITTKIKTNLVPVELEFMAALGLNYGEEKYAARNFEKGFALTDLTASLKRHVDAYEAGEEIDEDSQLHHVALIASCTAMLCHNYMQRVLVDDRPVKKAGLPVDAMAREAKMLEDDAKAARERRRLAVPTAGIGSAAESFVVEGAAL